VGFPRIRDPEAEDQVPALSDEGLMQHPPAHFLNELMLRLRCEDAGERECLCGLLSGLGNRYFGVVLVDQDVYVVGALPMPSSVHPRGFTRHTTRTLGCGGVAVGIGGSSCIPNLYIISNWEPVKLYFDYFKLMVYPVQQEPHRHSSALS
jgi:hypothetical protein